MTRDDLTHEIHYTDPAYLVEMVYALHRGETLQVYDGHNDRWLDTKNMMVIDTKGQPHYRIKERPQA